MTTAPAGSSAAPHATYLARLDEGVLAFQRCGACTLAVFPPRSRCPHCGAAELAWHESAGVGTVYAATQISPRNDPSYAVVLLDLDEGFRMMSRVDGVDERPVAIDDRVTTTFVEVDGQLQPYVVTTGEES